MTAAEDTRPIILEARCDRCSRFVRVTGVWRQTLIGELGAVTAVDVECKRHGKRTITSGFGVWWPGE